MGVKIRLKNFQEKLKSINQNFYIDKDYLIKEIDNILTPYQKKYEHKTEEQRKEYVKEYNKKYFQENKTKIMKKRKETKKNKINKEGEIK